MIVRKLSYPLGLSKELTLLSWILQKREEKKENSPLQTQHEALASWWGPAPLERVSDLMEWK